MVLVAAPGDYYYMTNSDICLSKLLLPLALPSTIFKELSQRSNSTGGKAN